MVESKFGGDNRVKHVLVINTIGFGYEGISNVLRTYLSKINGNEIKIDIVIYPSTPASLIQEIEQYANCILLPQRKEAFILYLKELCRLLLKNKYNAIHINGNSSTMSLEALVAKLLGIKKIIVHGHSSSTDHPVINVILRPLLLTLSDVRISCSNEAGMWLYGKKEFYVLRNSIDTSRFSYSDNSRLMIRKQYGLEDKFVLGHIGYYDQNKNQQYLLRLLKKVSEYNNNVHLLLVGKGLLCTDFQDKVQELNIEHLVTMINGTDKPELYYSAMDCFLFPSLHEGFGLVLIEAQANGLPCIASLGVPLSTNVSNQVQYCDIGNEDDWVKYIIKLMSNASSRKESSKANVVSIKESGYSINDNITILQDIYIKD